ncbi:Hypothetical protein, putative [Bodo saltans]|uniref:Uncharacterized protein n=1 Tax=Bodo saltans TaxID=75058 RepID=A0A0S4J7N7_BODSA|nr:Hypothetical protein, putative [Bodo saltans]|eukprot:CUG86212.1 Hypothetical protein, putative [Bodo saltans]
MHSWTHSITTPHLQPCSHGSVPATSFFNSSITLIPTAVKTLMMPNASGRVGDIAPDIAAGASCGRRSLTHSAIYRPSSCAPIHIGGGGGGGSVTPYAHRNSLMSPAGGRCSITAPPPPPKIVRLDDTVPTFVEQPGDLTMALDRVTRVSDEQNKELLAKIAALHALMVSLISIVSEANTANINAIEQQHQELVPPTRSGSALSLRSSSHDVSNPNPNNNNNISVDNDEVVTNTTGLEKLSMGPEAPMILHCPLLHKSRCNISSTTSSSSSTQCDGGLIRHALRKLVTYLCETLVAWIMRMRASAASIQPHYANASSTTSVELCGLSAARSWFLQLVTQF